MLEKIPSNYLDYEWVQYLNRTNQYTAAPPSNNLSNANYIWSYHGSDIQIISSLLNKPKTVNDLKKICFKGDEQIWNSRWGGWK
jgi:hypothetical protein